MQTMLGWYPHQTGGYLQPELFQASPSKSCGLLRAGPHLAGLGFFTAYKALGFS